MEKQDNKAILLLQMGGPCCTANIQNFLFNLFNDPYIIQLPKFLKPFQKQLANFISSRRAPKVAENYEMIGGRSPILFETMCQAKALEKRLGSEYRCFIAMRYSYPFLKDSFKDIEALGVDELTVIPLYPQYSIATSGSSIFECRELFSKTGFDQKAKIKYIESWQDNEFFIELITHRIIDRLSQMKTLIANQENKKIKLLFSAHGLPVKYITNGDPYQKQIEDSTNLILQNLANKLGLKNYTNNLCSNDFDIDWMITFQSRVGPVKWLEPNTEDILEELGSTGTKNVIIVPISFVGDHIETLHELGTEYAELASHHGITNYLITRLPKANPLLIEALASLVPKAIKSKVGAR